MGSDGLAQLGDYRLLEQLGHGGMAVVYRGERLGEAGFKKIVALKRMLPQYRRDPSLLERFAAEARTNARLDHPNLVAVVDFGVKPEPYLVMEFVEGVSLASLLHRLSEQGQQLEVAAACFIGAEAASGLDHAHRKRDDAGNPLGIVHRDVSPQNVLLSNEGAVKVSDFGLVKAADNVVQTGSGIPIGKISYMAPEQAQHHEVDARADVFSLGIVVWEMLAMRVLLPSNDPVHAAQQLQICNFDPPSKYNPDVSPELDAIVMACLAKDPTARTPSMQAVGMALREVVHEIAPGYGRDQLARLLGWAFPERGWELDEPHETAAQPSLKERMSMPPAETAAEAIQRTSSPPAVGPVTQVSVEKPPPIVSAPAAAGAALPPNVTGPHPRLPSSDTAIPVQKKQTSALPWVLLLISVIVFGVIALAVVGVVLFKMGGPDDDTMGPPPPSLPMEPPANGTGGAPTTTRIDSNVPARVFAGETLLGVTPLDVALEGMPQELVVLVAHGHRPAVVRRIQLMGQQHFNVTLVPDARPDRAVFVSSERRGVARVAFGGEQIGAIPGLILVPSTTMGGTSAIVIRFQDGDRQRFMLECEQDEVCGLDVDDASPSGPRVLEW